MTQKPDAVELIEDALCIPMRQDTRCRKCGQFFFKGDSMMSSHCTTDNQHHDWFSLAYDHEQLTAEREALLREVEAGKSFIGGIYKLLDDHGDCERGCMTCIAMRRIRETYLASLEGESR